MDKRGFLDVWHFYSHAGITRVTAILTPHVYLPIRHSQCFALSLQSSFLDFLLLLFIKPIPTSSAMCGLFSIPFQLHSSSSRAVSDAKSKVILASALDFLFSCLIFHLYKLDFRYITGESANYFQPGSKQK